MKAITPKLQQKEYDDLAQVLISQKWVTKSYDLNNGKVVYEMTNTGGMYYVFACLLLEVKSIFKGQAINPLTKIEVDLSMKNTYVNYMITNNIIVKSLDYTTGLPKTALSETGSKLFFVLTTMVGKSKLPTTLGVKFERGMFKTIKILGQVANTVDQMTSAFTSQPEPKESHPVKKFKQHTHKHKYKPRPREFKKPERQPERDVAERLSDFPNPNRERWDVL